MTDLRLQDHYDRKYCHERTDPSELAPVPRTDQPTDRFEAVVNYFPCLFKGGSVLELGAGDGKVAKALLGLDIRIERYTVGDISRPRLERIPVALGDRRVAVKTLNAEDISGEEENQYDAIIMVALIEHLIDPLGAMKSIRTLLKPGGFVYIDTPNIAKYTRRANLLLGRFPSTASRKEGLVTYDGLPVDLYDEGHLHYFTYSSLSTMLLSRCGFTRIRKLPYPCGKLLFGKTLESWLAHVWPTAFADLAIAAYR